MNVGIVVASHSDLLARGVVELAGQMAGGVAVVPAGGDDEGGIGTSFQRIMTAIEEADSGDGAVILTDLGSATMTAEQAIEFLDPDQPARVRLVDAPLAEGSLAAATTAAGGADLDTVEVAARQASGTDDPDAAAVDPATGTSVAETAPDGHPDAAAEVTVTNAHGLHARPASHLAQAAQRSSARLRIRRLDSGDHAEATSMLRLVALGTARGTPLAIEGWGEGAEEAVDSLRALIADGFGETDGAEETDGARPTFAQRPGEGVPTAAEGPAVGDGARAAADPGRPTEGSPTGTLRGTGAVPGIVIGPAAPLRQAEVTVDEQPADDPAHEEARLDGALEVVSEALASEGGDIFAAHRALLDDPALREEAVQRIRSGASAGAAWRDAFEGQASTLAALPGEFAAARAADVRDVGLRVLAALRGGAAPGLDVPPGAVVVATDVLPSQVPALVEAGAAGLALARGSRTAHAAILARNLDLPLVLGLGPDVPAVAEGATLVLDGRAGTLLVDPDEAALEAARAERDTEAQRREQARELAGRPVHTAAGERVELAANASTPAEARAAVDAGAEAIGLLRTEFLFSERADLPSEDEQVDRLTAVVDALAGRPVTVRTLDAGGDKPMPALDLDPVRNGFLGVRGLRLSLARPELFHTQLRAILRVATGRRLRVMFPMVTTADEVARAREAVDAARDSLAREGVPYGEPEAVGIMVEVPAAAVAPEDLLDGLDFVSVGSNDLAAYTMAADRTVTEVAPLAQPDHPAIARLIGWLCEAARARGVWVGVCGEMAGEPEYAAGLVDLGVRELSMAPGAIADVKQRLLTVPAD
ncbi:phosphoenolpyruvate--protein phosphotransferase [Egibacter rhizosphaerae]|uniref:Phosphocarrier protein HPr n=1 Tax=Egibacter rhizosphaerae TaxID=1670831 RepID=A0A411YHH6_9ACTN|nr:phosphoenolpyruvate--protein phosphotransferase [Egibacter rhizosphaerae]QBI20667.1 phosphoenolpyruvate--protein phosphotransferase [Egibacter rhizosphaerae]